VQTKLLHLRLGKDETETLDRLAGNVLSRQQVAVMIMSAALAAVREDPDKLKFPPLFTVATERTPDTERILKMNEPGRSKGK
jgi:hypothetical protein